MAPAPEPEPEPEPAPVVPSVSGQAILNLGLSYVGVPYVWGHRTPAGWDCLGFVSWIYTQSGIPMSNSYDSVLSAGRHLPYSQARPGDILYWPGHVAISLGNGQNVGGRFRHLGVLHQSGGQHLPGLQERRRARLCGVRHSGAGYGCRPGHCHRADGPAKNSGLYLLASENDPSRLGVGKAPVAAGKGSGGLLYGIVPGKPDESILQYRIESVHPGVMMPELGRSITHEEGVALVRQWIKEMQ